MKYSITAIWMTFLSLSLIAQVDQKIIVEHFTNSRCGICANRNPGFYANRDNHPGTLHISFHPSSPYSNCVLNNHNTSENDARTNYYNNFGSTPKFVVQGDRITGAIDVSKPELYTPYEGMTSPVELKINQQVDVDSVHSEIVVKAVTANSLDTVKLFVAVAEDTVFYNAPNGENEHYDVFRVAMTNILGDDISVPANAGDSSVFQFSRALNSEWDVNHIFTVGILQDASDKSVIQAEATNAENVGTPVGISKISTSEMQLFPNPSSGVLALSNTSDSPVQVSFYDRSGRLIFSDMLTDVQESKIILPEHMENGLYIVNLRTSNVSHSTKILLQR